MKPAYSVILFTTASGAGYGLLVLMALFAAADAAPTSRWFGFLGLFLALGAITIGLVGSLFHLGRPDRAWRALSQWRSSWLSRQAVFALAVYVPALLFAFGWVVMGNYSGPWRLFGTITAVFSVFTVYCTGMIFATIRPVLAWSNRHTVRIFILLAAWTGGLWFNLLVHLFEASTPVTTMVVIMSGFVAFYMKRRYWRFLDTTHSPATLETATGLQGLGDIRLLQGPSTRENYVQNEMVFVIARNHAQKLRRTVFIATFAFPIAAAMVTMEQDYAIAVSGAVAAAVSGMFGIWIERLLFFAEAKHTAALYYGATEV